MAMGHAAGVTAALASKNGVEVAAIDADAVRDALARQNAVVDVSQIVLPERVA
jgi:hypothetical protein